MLPNYKVVDNPTVKNKRCLVCFSSNGLYYPNTDSELSRVINNDRYEWESIIPTNYSRVIFVRDIFKQWYVAGINVECNSIDKLCMLLLELCKGYKSIFIGSSAGGYAAALIGSKVGAQYCLCFAGQFDILDVSKDKTKNKILNQLDNYKYINISDKVKNVFYFVPEYSEQDAKQLERVLNKENILPILFNTDVHGIPFKPYAIKKVISLPYSKLIMLTNKRHNSILFSLKYVDFNDFFTYFKIKLQRLLNNRSHKEK